VTTGTEQAPAYALRPALEIRRGPQQFFKMVV
jgi:hypothetical protein